MSSTNRGYDRHKSDYYVTPVSEIEKFINEFIKYEPTAFNEGVLDSCAGGDDKHYMSYPIALSNIGFNNYIKTIDIRDDSLAEIKQNYLDMNIHNNPQTIITNPPFNLAESIIKKSLDDVQDGGFVIMLLRLNFFGGKKRFNGFWNDVGLPKYTFVHHKRMSFSDNGNTDSIEYQHAVWQKGYNPDFTRLKVI